MLPAMLKPQNDPLTNFVGLLEPKPVVRVTTQGSLWLVSDTTYTRMPKTESPDPDRPHYSPWGRLDDFVRHPYRSAWWGCDAWGDIVLRILPEAGPEGGRGVISSPVMSIANCAFSHAIPTS